MNDYPHLRKPLTYGPVTGHFYLFEAVPAKLANVNIFPFTAGGEVILMRVGDVWDLPGGTLEAAETWQQAAHREVLEEVGAALTGPIRVFGGWRCKSSATEPYRPHLPHPVFWRIVGTARARMVQAPTTVPGAEVIAEVRAMPVDEAVRNYEASQRPDLADLLRLAAKYPPHADA